MSEAEPTVEEVAAVFDAPTTEEQAAKSKPARTKKYPVMEIFGPTIQGEGAVAGYQTMFIRFGGCDYKCAQCDSMHAVVPAQVKANAAYLTTKEIFAIVMKSVDKTNCRWITLSGGNPAIHDLHDLIMLFKHANIKISVETQATYWQPWMQYCDAVVLSPKSPGMGEKFEEAKFANYVRNLSFHPNTTIKIVLFTQRDIEFALYVFKLVQELWIGKVRPLPWKYVSLGNPMPPKVDGGPSTLPFDPEALTKHYRVILEDLLADPRTKDWIILPQIHVLIWGNKQGV